jgi:hypothetical protein
LFSDAAAKALIAYRGFQMEQDLLGRAVERSLALLDAEFAITLPGLLRKRSDGVFLIPTSKATSQAEQW